MSIRSDFLFYLYSPSCNIRLTICL